MIPPLWHCLMTPKVPAWDRDYANARSGIPLLQQASGAAGAPAANIASNAA